MRITLYGDLAEQDARGREFDNLLLIHQAHPVMTVGGLPGASELMPHVLGFGGDRDFLSNLPRFTHFNNPTHTALGHQNIAVFERLARMTLSLGRRSIFPGDLMLRGDFHCPMAVTDEHIAIGPHPTVLRCLNSVLPLHLAVLSDDGDFVPLVITAQNAVASRVYQRCA